MRQKFILQKDCLIMCRKSNYLLQLIYIYSKNDTILPMEKLIRVRFPERCAEASANQPENAIRDRGWIATNHLPG